MGVSRSAAAYLIRKHLLHQDVKPPTWQAIFITGWTGMRGVIALAAAISLPQQLADGTPFPQRNVIIFLTFSVILVTLVLQGLTLPSVIRALGFAEEKTGTLEEQQARRTMLSAALEHLGTLERKNAEQQAVWDDISRHYQQRLSTIEDEDPKNPLTAELRHSRELTKELRRVERTTLQRMHNEEKISDAVLRKLERELDLLDARFSSRV